MGVNIAGCLLGSFAGGGHEGLSTGGGLVHSDVPASPREGSASLPPPAQVYGGGSEQGGLQVPQYLWKHISYRYDPAYLGEIIYNVSNR